MSPDVAPLLTDAADAIDARCFSEAAAKLLEAWHTCRSERIARALASVDLRLPPPAPLEGKLVKTREEHWHALVQRGDVESLRRALAAPWPTHPKEARERVRALAPHISARVSNALLAVHRSSQYPSVNGTRLSRDIFQLLITADDHAVVGELERLEQQAYEAARLGRAVLRRRRPEAPVLSPAAEAALARIAKAFAVEERPDGSSRDNLLAAIYATPQDDAPRLVYADVLTEAGDPRGELITLQLQGGDPKRVQKLLRTAGRAWFDGLDADGATKIVHRRGFPAEATLSAGEIRAPAWATIEALRLANDGTFAGALHLRALRSLYGVSAQSLATATFASPDLDVLAVRDLTPALPATAVAPRVLGIARIPHLPNVTPIVRALVDHPLARRLETVRCTAGIRMLAPALALAREVPFTIELMGGWGIEVGYQWSARVTPRALAMTWHGNGPYGDVAFETIVAVLDALATPPFETLEITGAEVGQERVQEALIRITARWPKLRRGQILGVETTVTN